MSTFDDASLVFIPSGYKTSKAYSVKPSDGSGDLTFSRSNDTATRVNSAGLIEKVRTNYVLQSNTFSTTWLATDLTVTSGATDPNGGTTAWTAAATAASGIIQQTVTLTGLRTFSIYAKQGTLRYLYMGAYGGTISYATFDLQDGVVAAGTNARIESVGGGWYRCTCHSADGTTGGVQILPTDTISSGTIGTGNILIWRAQYEAGDIATDYIATTSAAVSVGPVANVPRLDYLNSSCPRLLLEPQRTNLLTYSEQFNNAAYILNNATITANSVVSPDGYTNADTYTASGSNNYLNAFGSSSGSNTVTYSVFVKAGTQSVFRIREAFYFGTSTIFNLSTGTVTSGTGTITSYGNGWYRCTMSQAYGAGQGNLNIIFDTTASSGTFYLYGAQAEVGAYATSYIPTLGAAVTRGADACSKTGISSLIGQTEGTIFAEINFDLGVTAQGDSRIQLSDGTTSNWIFMGLPDGASSNLIRMYVNAPSGSVSAYSSSPIVNGVNKIAFGYKSGSFVLYVNGVQAATSSTTLTMATCSRIDLQGSVPAASTSERENIKQVLLFKTRLTNAQLAELTTL